MWLASLSLIGIVALQAWEPVPPRQELLAQILEDEAPKLERATREALARTLDEVERELGVDALLLLAMMERESRYDPHARGVRGGLGLMQVQPIAAREAARTTGQDGREAEAQLLDPCMNVRLAATYLAAMKERFASWELALTAYNMGPGRLRALLGSGGRPRLIYARAVLGRYHELEQLERRPLVAGPLPPAVGAP